MKNADEPINPVLIQSPSLQNDTSLGLTKREYFAGLAMQGLLSSFMYNAENGFYGKDVVISTAIEYADELLKQLEENE